MGTLIFLEPNWSGEYQPVELWVNQTSPKRFGKWRRHVIDGDKPWKSVFIVAGDLDKDGYKDIVTGGGGIATPATLLENGYAMLLGTG